MKKLLQPIILSAALLLVSTGAGAQCTVTLNCPGNQTVNNDSGSCSALVNYTTPTATNSCNSTVTATFNYTGVLQTFTVPAGVTSITVDARGAQGGSVSTTCAATGGLGARIVGDVAVTPGEVITILVGQQGLTNGSDAGGGGGSYVVRTGNIPLIVAGGGGGASNNIGQCGANRDGLPGQATTSGTASANGLVAGGTSGNGGGASSGSGGGGGGFYTDGVAGAGLPGNNGKCFINGGAGGTGNNADFGGYGGGGAGWFTGGNGGGGGGYSGGATSGSQPYTGGGGGGSFNSGTNQTNTTGFQAGNGFVTISYQQTAPTTVSLLSGLASGSAFPVGVNTVTYVATDGAGGDDTCSFTITVIDNESPVFNCTNSMIVNVDSGTCTALVNYPVPVATDNCSTTTVQTAGLPSGSLFNIGMTAISYTTTDPAGHSAICNFTIMVVDNEAPVWICTGDVNSCDSVVTGIAPNATENCSLPLGITYTLSGATTGSGTGDASGTTFGIGTTLVTYTAVDGYGNGSTCAFNVTVNTPPSVTIGTSSSLLCLADAPAVLNASPASGTWTGPGVTGNNFDPATAGVGTHVLTYSYTDSSGCSASDTLSITVDVCNSIVDNGLDALQVSPNPTNGNMLISLGGNYSNAEVILTQLNGQIVLDEKYSNTTSMNLSLEHVAAGVYFLTIHADDQTRTVKVIRN